jgi:hypothetical protein
VWQLPRKYRNADDDAPPLRSYGGELLLHRHCAAFYALPRFSSVLLWNADAFYECSAFR